METREIPVGYGNFASFSPYSMAYANSAAPAPFHSMASVQAGGSSKYPFYENWLGSFWKFDECYDKNTETFNFSKGDPSIVGLAIDTFAPILAIGFGLMNGKSDFREMFWKQHNENLSLIRKEYYEAFLKNMKAAQKKESEGDENESPLEKYLKAIAERSAFGHAGMPINITLENIGSNNGNGNGNNNGNGNGNVSIENPAFPGQLPEYDFSKPYHW